MLDCLVLSNGPAEDDTLFSIRSGSYQCSVPETESLEDDLEYEARMIDEADSDAVRSDSPDSTGVPLNKIVVSLAPGYEGSDLISGSGGSNPSSIR